jgi:hypothetical protein
MGFTPRPNPVDIFAKLGAILGIAAPAGTTKLLLVARDLSGGSAKLLLL